MNEVSEAKKRNEKEDKVCKNTSIEGKRYERLGERSACKNKNEVRNEAKRYIIIQIKVKTKVGVKGRI